MPDESPSAQRFLRRNFSGTWTVNFERSKLQIPQPDSSVFEVEHKEPMFQLSRIHTVKGKSDAFSISLTTDGNEVVTRQPDRILYSRCFWEGECLVFHTQIVRKDREATNIVKYSLSADGRIITAEESLRDPLVRYDNIWVLEKQ